MSKNDNDQRSVHLGFPNPALDGVDIPLDLNKLVVKNRSSTFYMRVDSTSYEELGIHTKDILTIDRSLQMKSGDVYVGAVDGEFVISKYDGSVDTEIEFFGVITHIIHEMNR